MNAKKVIRFCQIGLLAVVGACIVLAILATFVFALDLDKNEKVNIWLEIGDRDGSTFTISSATMSVLANTGSLVMQSAASATISSTKIYGLVDTTAAAFTQGTDCRAKFTFVISDETYIEYVPLHIW